MKLADVQERCVPFGKGVVTLGGRTLLIDTAKGVVAFEWHSYCGPMPVNRRTGAGRDLSHKHPFWGAVTKWLEDGAVIVEGRDGTLWAKREGRTR